MIQLIPLKSDYSSSFNVSLGENKLKIFLHWNDRSLRWYIHVKTQQDVLIFGSRPLLVGMDYFHGISSPSLVSGSLLLWKNENPSTTPPPGLENLSEYYLGWIK